MGLKENYARIKKAIEDSIKRAGRKDYPLVVAVTKTVPYEVLFHLKELGIKDVGENYVQEMLQKTPFLPDLNWHFIGSLQKNKVKYIVGNVKLIHSLDSLSLAEEINKRAAKKGIVQPVLIQINQGEETKGGVSVGNTENLIMQLNNLPNLLVKGFMAMPPFKIDPEQVRPFFREIQELKDYVNSKGLYKEPLTELSMGMSGDYWIAVEEGATILRIGTALFGERER